jgi:hypothetical protein
MPRHFAISLNSSPYARSRSRSKYRGAWSQGNACKSYRAVHSAVGFADSAGISGAVGFRLRQPGHGNLIEINFGADSPDQHYANMRAYMWGKAKEWLLTGAIDADPRLEAI